MIGSNLLAQAATSRTYFEVMRLRHLDQWWHWLLLAVICGVIVAAITAIYIYDSRQLGRGKRWAMLVLRVLAFIGLLVFFLDLQKRTEHKLVKNSRFAVLIDASQSMGIVDPNADASRIAQLGSVMKEDRFIKQLRAKHDVAVYRFDETNRPQELAMFPQFDDLSAESVVVTPSQEDALAEVRAFWNVALVMFAVAAIALTMHIGWSRLVRTAEGESWAILVVVFMCIVGVVLIAVSNLRQPEYGPLLAYGFRTPSAAATAVTKPTEEQAEKVKDALTPSELAWTELLEPAGGATRLGDALRSLLERERGNPLAGIALVTDGNSNRGVAPILIARQAEVDEVAIFPVGMGTESPPENVRLVDLEIPPRVYPGDEFKMTGFIQSYGMAGRVVQVELVSQPEDSADEQTLVDELAVELPSDGLVLPVPIEVTPDDVGKRVYTLRLADANVDRDTSDNQLSAKVQIVDRKSRVLLLAGGPTREYRFVRNMLHRDDDVIVDVLLQTAAEGASQDANAILDDLPLDPGELFEYDAVIAFDPDWTEFDKPQLDLIEQWVAEKSGGLVCIVGPVNTPVWAEDRRAGPQIQVVRQLYPVTFRASRIQLGRYGSAVSWPLEITDDGRAMSFFSLADDEIEVDAWAQFDGVYGYYPIREMKPAATVLARYSDPQTAMDDQLPPLIVSQFYGSGRVVYLGTGEFWRLRSVDNAYFERFYIKLIRYVSEGRLLRDSNRGLLLVDKDKALRGDTIAVQATVVDQQFQPLRDASVNATLEFPDGATQQLELGRADSARDGHFSGRFQVTQPGDYQVQLVLPGDGDPVILRREVRVKLPNLEVEHPQRNDLLLTQLAEVSGGRYFKGLDAVLEGENTLAASVVSKRRETYLPGTPDRPFQLRLMKWLLALICGALFFEWTIRRLNKLA